MAAFFLRWLAGTLFLSYIEAATIVLRNTTSDYVWDLEIILFVSQSQGPFSMASGGTVSIDISSTTLIDSKHQTCTHISSMYYLQLYVLNEAEFQAVNNEKDYTSLNCYNEHSGSFQLENCWYYQKATQKYAIPIGDSSGLHTVHTVKYPSSYHLLLVNPCKVTYSIDGQIMLKNPWPSFEHLSVSERWRPQIVLLAMFLYLFGLIVWSTYLYLHSNHVLIHHKLLTFLLALRTMDEFIYYVSFLVYNTDGVSTEFDLLVYKILASMFEVLGFYFLLIVSMGYILYRPSLNMKQMKVAVGSILLYGCICVLDETCFLFAAYCHFIELFQFILRCFLLVGIVALLNALISSVHSVLRQEAWTDELKHAYLLLHSHKVLRWAFYIYVIGPITVYILYLSIFHWSEEWLYVMVNEDLIEPTLLAYIYYHFRPSPFFVHVNGIF